MSSKHDSLPTVSVVIPVHNGSSTLRPCLEAVTGCDGGFYECIVVDDGSTDDSVNIALTFPIQVLNGSAAPHGPAHARNRGSRVARGDILMFVDADVVLIPGAIKHVAKVFQEQPDLAAVFGSYDAHPRAPGVISQYRNLLHHFVHQNGSSEASTFWAGCGAIRRSIFEQLAGFDEKRFSVPSIEDIEMGYRLRQAGHRILLDKSLQGTHLKKWTLRSVIRTDVTCRALPWARLIIESNHVPNDLNLKLRERISGAVVLLIFPCLVLAAVRAEFLLASVAMVLAVLALNKNLYSFFWRQRGINFAVVCIPLHLLYYLYSGLSYGYVWLGSLFARIRPARVTQ